MYDKYPEYDIPEHNIIQKFFAQRWHAIVIELVMTLVLTVAAGRALDPFGMDDNTTDAQAIIEPAVVAPTTSINGISIETIERYGINYLRNQQYREAIGMYDLAIYAEPTNAEHYAWRGYANIQAGRYDAARHDYNRVVEIDEASFDAHNALCWAYGELGEFGQAMPHCDTALELAQTPVESVTAYENRCWIYVETEAYVDAYHDCMTVFEVEPNCTYESCTLAHYNLGRILYAQDKPTAALEHFNRALLYGATYAQMYMDIAQVYDELGYTSAALDSYEQYIKLAGEDANPMAQSRVMVLRGE